MVNKEFRLEDEKQFNRTGPVKWIASHLAQYPWLPVAAIIATVFNNFAASYIQVLIGRGFDVINQSAWANAALLAVAAAVFASALVQGLMGLARNSSVEFLAQRIERDTRDELYVSLLGKSQTFHGRQRIGDIMARATNDVRMLNFMFSPGLMLIIDSLMALVVPIVLIGQIDVAAAAGPRSVPRPAGHHRLRLQPAAQAGQRGPARAVRDDERRAGRGDRRHRGGQGQRPGGAGVGQVRPRRAPSSATTFVQQGEIQARYLPMLVFSLCLGGWPFCTRCCSGGPARSRWARSWPIMGLMGALRFPTFISIFSFNLVQLGIASAAAHPGADQHRDGAGRERGRRGPADPGRGRLSRMSALATTAQPVLQGHQLSRPSRARRSPSWARPARARPP